MKIMNRQFYREYEPLESFEAGIVLNGSEVKSIRLGRLNIDNAFIKIIGFQAYLINAQIAPYEFARNNEYEVQRHIKVLIHKKQLLHLQVRQKGGGKLTIVPISCYNKGRLIKLEIAICRGRKDIEKRRYEKGKSIERNQKREAKEYMKQRA